MSVSLAIATQGDEVTPRGEGKVAEQLTRTAFLNALAYIVTYSAQILAGLVLIPILVTGLGTTLFGVWQMLRQMVSYMAAADGRPTQALKSVIANRQAVDDAETKRRCIGSALGVWLIFLPVLTTAGVVLIWVSPSTTGIGAESHAVVQIACSILVVKFLFSGLVTLPDAVLRGMNLGYKRMGVQAAFELLGAALAAGAVYVGLGLIGVAGAEILLSILTGIFFWFLVRKCVPWFGVSRPSSQEMSSFFRLSIWYFSWTLINRLLLASDVVILGVLASPAVVTTYTVTGYASQMAVDLISMTAGAMMPGMGSLIGQQQFSRAAALHNEMLAMTWLSVTSIGSTILLWNRSFMHLWIGAEHYADFWANLLIVLVMVQLMFIRTSAYVIDVTLQMREKVIAGAMAVLLSVALATLLTPSFGIVGLCLGILLGRLTLTIAYPLIISSCLHASGRLPLLKLARPGIVMCLLLAGSAYLGQRILIEHWATWLIGVCVSLVAIVPLAVFGGMPGQPRRKLIKRCCMLWVQLKGTGGT